MRAFLFAILALVVISVGADFALREAGFSAAQRGAGDAVRLPE